jgi:plasmid maintenance system antidote protein VapI
MAQAHSPEVYPPARQTASRGTPIRPVETDLLRKLYEQERHTVSEIAVLVSISRPEVAAALKAAGVQWRSTRKECPIDHDHLRSMVADGTATPTMLARRYGVARNTAARWLADAGLLSADPAIDEKQLRELYVEQQLTTREVAAALGVNKSRILRALAAAGIAARPREVKRTRATREKP